MRYRHGLALFGPTWPLKKKHAAGHIKGFHGTPRAITGAERRERLRTGLESQQSGRSFAGSLQAAACGLEFTQPFRDKRVVELALAIPEDLWIKSGRERYLARQA